MKKLIYKSLYEVISLILSRFNIRLLTKFKLYLGIALLVIVSSCSKKDDEIKDDEGPTCYIIAEPPQESAKTEEPVKLLSHSHQATVSHFF